MPGLRLPPVFVVGSPGAGQGALLESLARSPAVAVARPHSATFLDGLPSLAEPHPERGHRLDADDAATLAEPAAEMLEAVAVGDEDATVVLAGGGRLALRVPFLAEAFPDARFVAVLAEEPPADDGGEEPLFPGASPEQRWARGTNLLLDDLEALDPSRWSVTADDTLVADPARELERLCGVIGLPFDATLAVPLEAVRRVRARPSARPPGSDAEPSPELHATGERVRDLVARSTARARRPQAPLASVSTPGLTRELERLGGTLAVSTYEAGKIVCVGIRRGRVHTHFRDVEKPMGLAVAPGRLAIGTRTEVWDLRDMPEAAAKVEPAGTFDACYLPRRRHVTGDVAVHDLAFAGGELWFVATAFSCLATLDADHSFVPRWAPPWITALRPEDRCHLNGLAVVEDAVRYVTALGSADTAGGWRPSKADGGVLIDVPSSETVVGGLSMPHSPRWHDGELYLLESGRGTLARVQPQSGTVETVAELPGFTRGLAFSGRTAFVGLSQIRDTGHFGDLPVTRRLARRESGVWACDLDTGAVKGFLRFQDIVREVYDVALLPGVRNPEIAEPGSPAVASSYALP